MFIKSPIPEANLLRPQMQLLTEAGQSAYFFSFFAIALVTYTLWSSVPPILVAVWSGLLLVVTLARYFHFRTFSDAQDEQTTRRFLRWFTIGSVVSACGWGVIGIFILLIDDASKQMLIGFVASCVAAGAVVVSSSLINVTRAFIAITLLPVIGAFIAMGESFLLQAILAVGFWVFLNFLLNAIHASIINLFNSTTENTALIQQLQENKKNAEAVNHQLKNEILVRNEAQAQMIEARDNAEKAARAKSEFLATMSHEIRTPMNGVLGMTELLMNTSLSAKQYRFADTIRRSGEALLAIINDILDFSKIDAGKLEIQHTVFDLRQLIEDVASFFAEAAQRKHIELVCNFPPSEHAAYRGDPDRIRQILMNLVGNALKFTDHGEIAIRISSQTGDEDKSILRFEITDSGIGIPAEHQTHIFGSFQQADASTTRKFGGTGLGLAICSRLVELMHGAIGVESEPGKGSTFWFTITATVAPTSAVSNSLKNTLDFNGLNALIVDDNETNREVLEHQLANWGMTTTSASGGNDAIRLLNRSIDQEKPFDIVILDRKMPEIDGVELAHRISSNELTKQVAIVMLSSINQLEETGNWYSAGIDCYVNKPVRQAELYEALGIALQEKNKIAVSSNEHNKPTHNATSAKLNAHVLVAEDNPINQELARTMLEDLGCSVVLVDNGRQAVEAITQASLDQLQGGYDMTFMDCQMPELDGYQATQEIRDWELSATSRMPIIALTANAMAGDRERCLEAGMDDYLTKPFSQEALAAICSKWLSLEKKLSPQIAEDKTRQANAAHHSGVVRAKLDQSTLDNIRKLQRADGPDILAKIINLFLKNAPPMLEKIQEAISTGNAELLKGTAHSLKSSSGNLGATKLSELCKELEAMGRDKTLDNALTTLGVLEFEFEGVCAALQHELQKAAA